MPLIPRSDFKAFPSIILLSYGETPAKEEKAAQNRSSQGDGDGENSFQQLIRHSLGNPPSGAGHRGGGALDLLARASWRLALG
jgi:hypothetical protein